MNRTLGSACLVAGTAIGAGVMALPMTFANLGIIPTLALMVLVWAVMHHTSLVNLELNLQAGEGLPLGDLASRFSGIKACWVGHISLLLLMNALLAAYLYGFGSVLSSFLSVSLNIDLASPYLTTLATLGLAVLLMLPTAKIEYANRVLFIGLVGLFVAVIVWLASHLSWQSLPWMTLPADPLKTLRVALPVVFTSFGFQVIFHTLTNYCEKNPTRLKRAFFWGSLIPLILYVLWTVCVLGVIAANKPEVYAMMQQGKVDVGGLVEALAQLSHSPLLQTGSWIIMILAIATSAIGVGLGLLDSWKNHLSSAKMHGLLGKLAPMLLTLLPAYGVAVWLPGAFIKTLGFAGMILVVIAIGLPLYLLWASRASMSSIHYQLAHHKGLQAATALFGGLILLAELSNLLG